VSTDNEDPHYAVFSAPLLLLPSLFHISPYHILTHTKPMFLLQLERPSFTPV